MLDLVDRSSDDAVVTTPAGTTTLVSYLPTRSFELVVHSLDLAAALHVHPPGQLHQPIAGCLQLAIALAARRPESAQVLLALTGRRGLPAASGVRADAIEPVLSPLRPKWTQSPPSVASSKMRSGVPRDRWSGLVQPESITTRPWGTW